MSRVELPHFQPFAGLHCETVATGTLLTAAGLKLSEPMLFGLGEGPLRDAAQRSRRVADIEVAAMRLLAEI